MQLLLDLWAQRAPRERQLIGAAFGVLLAAIVYLLLIEPAASGIARLTRTLPATRTQSMQLEQLLAEAAALKSRPQVATLAAAETRAALEKSLAAAGLKAAKIAALSDGGLQMTFANVPYAAWSGWLAAAERELGVKAANVLARSTGTPGAADIDVSLRLPRR